MKRDWDIVRHCLQTGSFPSSNMEFVERDNVPPEVCAHYWRLRDAGLVKADWCEGKSQIAVWNTWRGEDLLKAMGTDEQWDSIKQRCRDAGVPIYTDLIFCLARERLHEPT